jgi:hypothetical protein
MQLTKELALQAIYITFLDCEINDAEQAAYEALGLVNRPDIFKLFLALGYDFDWLNENVYKPAHEAMNKDSDDQQDKFIRAYTDHPFLNLGDILYKDAPIRGVDIISYDGNKYCKIKVNGVLMPCDVKVGYLYSKPGRFGEVPCINTEELEKLIGAQ